MSDFFDPKLVEFIRTGGTLNPQGRATVFKNIAQVLSLIPLRNHSKKARYANWQEACLIRPIFNPKPFAKANAGVACGPASGVLVLDIDDQDGFKEWMIARGLSLPLPQTLTVQTDKGEHHYFRYPDDSTEYRSRSIRMKVPGPDVMFPDQDKGIFDIKGFGGYVVAPGSIHPKTGKPYGITKNLPPAEAPQWLQDLALGKDIPVISDAGTAAEDSPINQEAPQQSLVERVSVEDLPISRERKIDITTPHPLGTRSDKEWAVIASLVAADVPDETIHAVFEYEYIGEKNREHGEGRFKRLDAQIAKAREHVLQGSKRQDVYCCYSVADILNENRQVEFLVEGMLIRDEVFMIIGDGGVGKSLFGLNLAMQIADPPADGFLGRFPIPKPAKTLFIQSENSMATTNNRMRRILGLDEQESAEAIPSAIKQNVLTMGMNGDLLVSGNFQDRQFLDKVKGQIEEHRPDLLIIDPLISFHAEDENLNSPMRRMLDVIKDMAVTYGLTVGIVHHTGKNPEGKSKGGGRGASAIGNWSRNSFELVKKEGGTILLKHVKANDLELMKPLELELGPDLRFKVVSQLPTTLDSRDAMIRTAFKSLSTATANQSTLAGAIVQESKSSGGPVSKSKAIRWIKESKAIETVDGKTTTYKLADTP